ncbi:MAG: hypothetical protein ACTSVY_08175 [Candidatus Helarchaeota archaeon]
MPELVYCKKCGNVLYESIELISPNEVLKRFGEHCPSCNRKLEFNPTLVQISSQ